MGMALKISHLKEKLIIQQKTSHQSFFIKISGEGNGNPLQYYCLEISWTEEPCRLQSMGSQRVKHNWSDFYSVDRTIFNPKELKSVMYSQETFGKDER